MNSDIQSNLEEKSLRAQKIFPRNLTARAGVPVAGNPVVTRLESGVGNCYPGLEYDHRNLDRRFFPGLIFDFVSQDDAVSPNFVRRGLHLTEIDRDDPELRNDTDLAKLIGANAAALSEGAWFVDEIEQDGKTILTYEPGGDGGEKNYFDGLIVYNFVRGLNPDKVKIKLENRAVESKEKPTLELSGWRRKFLNEDGVISPVFQAGELTQSLCSPWQHDFRDCACNYWASNHPDIVLTENEVGESLLPTGGSADPFLAQTFVDWLRADRNRGASAEVFPTRGENRPFQMDHYEINRRWEQLAIVLEGKEISSIYYPGEIQRAEPLASPQEVADRLKYLASLEHVLILEYLYAYFSIANENLDTQQFPGIDEAVIFARHQLLMIAVSEMRHLRWANQILWELEHAGLISSETGPALEVAKEIPAAKGKMRERELRILTMDTLQDFIDVESPSGTLDGQYASVAATLRQPLYPASVYQLAERIITDGVEHFSRFRELKLVLKNYRLNNGGLPYLLDLTPADPIKNELAANALKAYAEIIANLAEAYEQGDMENARYITEARLKMEELETCARELAADGFGVPFFDF